MMKSVMLWRGDVKGKPRPRFTRQGHAYTPDSYRCYESEIAMEYVKQGGMFYSGEVSVTLMTNRKPPKSQKGEAPDIKKVDIDNALKAFLDSLNGVAYADDAQVTAVKAYKLPRGRFQSDVTAVLVIENVDGKTNEERTREWLRYTRSTRG